MKADNNAPLFAKEETIINVPIQKVWEIQADINNWPNWQKGQHSNGKPWE